MFQFVPIIAKKLPLLVHNFAIKKDLMKSRANIVPRHTTALRKSRAEKLRSLSPSLLPPALYSLLLHARYRAKNSRVKIARCRTIISILDRYPLKEAGDSIVNNERARKEENRRNFKTFSFIPLRKAQPRRGYSCVCVCVCARPRTCTCDV